MAPGLGDKLRRLVTGKGRDAAAEETADAIEYQGYEIRPTPRDQGGQWLTAGVITKRIGDEVKEHRFVRADSYGSKDAAVEFTIFKAKQMIDAEGDSLFARRSDHPGPKPS